MRIEEAQSEVSTAYVGGGIGAIVSGLVWLVAGIVTATAGVAAGFAALFFGGMAIFPLSALASRGLFGRPPVSAENPLGRIALESTLAMGAMLLVAFAMIPVRPALVLPIAALGVGTHYFAFASAYGDRTYWVLAACLTAVGAAGFFGAIDPFDVTAYAFGAIEVAFGAWFILRERR